MFSSFLSKASCQAADKETQPGLVTSLSPSRTIAAAAVNAGESCEFASAKYFALCGLGGMNKYN